MKNIFQNNYKSFENIKLKLNLYKQRKLKKLNFILFFIYKKCLNK